ncbi:hypothetical protein ACHQM5_000954 [Ranunculus cassubicifolius]
MTQKDALFKGQKKKKQIAVNRHGKSITTRKGKRVVKPNKVTKEMDSDKVFCFLLRFLNNCYHIIIQFLFASYNLAKRGVFC